MRTRIATAVSCFAIALGGASVAHAQSFSPAPADFEIVNSEFTVEQTQELVCNIDGFEGSVATGGGSATIDVGPTLLEGDDLCDNVGLDSSDWVITPTGGSSVSVSGISATTLLGTCSGTVTGTFSGNTLSIPRQTIPGDVFGFPMDCYIEGDATTDNDAISLVP